MKNLFCFILSLLLATACSVTVSAKGAENIKVTGYEKNVDYIELMRLCAEDDSEYALQSGWIYEQKRNLKIEKLKLNYRKTTYFTDYDNGADILAAMDKPKYTAEDLDLLSRLVMAESGCDWFPDWVQQLTASVVINRVNSDKYPNTIHDVIFQSGQYGPAGSGAINNTPSKKVIDNCRYVLDRGATCPSNVFGQAGHISGTVYKSYYDRTLGTTTYYCFG